MNAKARRLPIIGWREWLGLPELGIWAVKAKVDTGARSSSLHAYDLQSFRRRGRQWVRFKVHPFQRDTDTAVAAESEVIDWRRVRTSGGHQSLRPVIITAAELLEKKWDIELTLAARETMGFRMLLGREAVRGAFLVDPGRSYLGGRERPRRYRRSQRSSG